MARPFTSGRHAEFSPGPSSALPLACLVQILVATPSWPVQFWIAGEASEQFDQWGLTIPLPDQSHAIRFGHKTKEMEPAAGPGGTYSWIKLTMEVHSSALRAEVGQGLAA